MEKVVNGNKKKSISVLGLVAVVLLIAGFFMNYISIEGDLGISGYNLIRELFQNKEMDGLTIIIIIVPFLLLVASVILIIFTSLGQQVNTKLILAAKIIPLLVLTIATVYFVSAFLQTGPALAVFNVLGIGFYAALAGSLLVLFQPAVTISRDRKLLITVLILSIIIMGMPWLKYSSKEFGIEGTSNGFNSWGSLALTGILWLFIFVFLQDLATPFKSNSRKLLSIGFLFMLVGSLLYWMKESKPSLDSDSMAMKFSIGYGIFAMAAMGLLGIIWSFSGRRNNSNQHREVSDSI